MREESAGFSVAGKTGFAKGSVRGVGENRDNVDIVQMWPDALAGEGHWDNRDSVLISPNGGGETMATDNLDHWKTKAEAAEILECSEKTIGRLAAQKKIQKVLRRMPGRKPLPVFSPDDIEQIRQETMKSEAVVVEEQGSGKALVRQSGRNGAELLARLVAGVSSARVSVPQKIYLNLDEAVEYSGMPRAWLLRKIKSGELKAMKAGGWKIRRSELEEL